MQMQSLTFCKGHRSLQKNNVHRKIFVENLSLLVIQNHLPTELVKSTVYG
jgi:hypothetical protein